MRKLFRACWRSSSQKQVVKKLRKSPFSDELFAGVGQWEKLSSPNSQRRSQHAEPGDLPPTQVCATVSQQSPLSCTRRNKGNKHGRIMTHQKSEALRPFTRRQFLKTAGVTTGALALGLPHSSAAARVKTLPKPQLSGIEHIVVVCMENRSFDHFVGWTPGADGQQSGLMYPDRNGVLQPTYPLVTPMFADYIVVVCMENRSFDHFVGWTPGAD